MTLFDALEIVVTQTGIERFRVLCAEDNPDVEQRDAYRALVIRLATGEPEPSAAPPSPEDAALQAYVARVGPCCGG